MPLPGTARRCAWRWACRWPWCAVQAGHAPGESPEDAARKARYRALAEAARSQGAQEVLLAQHADDQVETVLLALSRGAGLPGLAAMPAAFERHGMHFGRPLLAVSAAAIRAWLQSTTRWPMCEDPTNADLAFTRNRIRHVLLPRWRTALPSTAKPLPARPARGQAQQLLDEVAAQKTCGPPASRPPSSRCRPSAAPGQATCCGTGCARRMAPVVQRAQLAELLDQVQACTTRGHQIRIKVGGGFVERGRSLAYRPGECRYNPEVLRGAARSQQHRQQSAAHLIFLHIQWH
jgi:tRNA(Ile)-lysidine synthase